MTYLCPRAEILYQYYMQAMKSICCIIVYGHQLLSQPYFFPHNYQAEEKQFFPTLFAWMWLNVATGAMNMVDIPDGWCDTAIVRSVRE